MRAASGGPTSESGMHPTWGRSPRRWPPTQLGRRATHNGTLRCAGRRCAICDLRPQASIVWLCGGDLVEGPAEADFRCSRPDAGHVYGHISMAQRGRECKSRQSGRRTRRLMDLLNVGVAKSSCPLPHRPPRPGARSRATLSLQNIRHCDRSGAGARRPKKYQKKFHRVPFSMANRRLWLDDMVGLSKNPTICRRHWMRPPNRRPASSCRYRRIAEAPK